MIKWYQDKEIKIFFSIIPNVKARFLTPYCNKNEIKEYKEKPFINLEKLDVELFDCKKNKKYFFEIKKDYTWDGASIPRMFWRLIGSKTEPEFLIPSLIHDVLCENHSYVDNDRYFSTKVFEKLLKISKVNPFKRWLMFHSVDNYQKFRRWKNEL